MSNEHISQLNLENLEIAFSSKSQRELKRSLYIFRLMQIPFFVNLGSLLGVWLIKINFPFINKLIKNSIFKLFCGGETLENCKASILELQSFNVETILDYGAEAKSTAEDFNRTMEEFIRAIQYAGSNESVPTVSMKVTGLIDFGTLVKCQQRKSLTANEKENFNLLQERLDHLTKLAHQNGVRLFVDAEESWIQDVIDQLVGSLQEKYNKSEATIFNTIQLYRHDRLEYLHQSYEWAKDKKYILGVKLVRGAYMEKERKRAAELDYKSPIQIDKDATDRDYNIALKFCIQHVDTIAMYNASHNIHSNILMTEIIENEKLVKDHAHLNFCQLYGMSDFITFNLAAAGFSVTKYMPYGQIKEVIPYLIRRAQENSAVQGEMGREYQMIYKEYKRRRNNRELIEQ